MIAETRNPPWKNILRWVARVWSLLIFIFAAATVLTPDPYATEPVPLEDWFLLSLWGISVLGLLLAWRWELLGGTITIGTMFIREFAWMVLKGGWFANFLIIWLFLIPPAILFVITSQMDRNADNA